MRRAILRTYLREFPLRDGKAWFYNRWHEQLLPPERYVVVNLHHSFNVRLDLADPEQRKIYFYGQYEERHEIALVRRVLEKNEVFWDIGANIGYFSLVAAATLQHTGRVVAFEPGETAYRSFLDNMALNPFDNITIFPVAAADRAGPAVLYGSEGRADGCASLYDPDQSRTHGQACQTVALDQFAGEAGLPLPDFIKMDVEGAEWAALQGARQILQDRRPLLLLEMKDAALKAAGANKGIIQTFLGELGYRPAFLHRRRWYLGEDVTRARSRNIFWFHPGLAGHQRKAARIPVMGGPGE